MQNTGKGTYGAMDKVSLIELEKRRENIKQTMHENVELIAIFLFKGTKGVQVSCRYGGL